MKYKLIESILSMLGFSHKGYPRANNDKRNALKPALETMTVETLSNLEATLWTESLQRHRARSPGSNPIHPRASVVVSSGGFKS